MVYTRRWIVALGLLLPPPALAEFNVGAGVTVFQLSSDHPSIPDVSPLGWQLQFGFASPSRHHALVMTAGGSEDFDVDAVDNPDDPFYPPDTAGYGFVDFGYRYQFKPAAPLLPYLAVAVGFSSISWNTFAFDQSGPGPGLGAGMLFDIADNWMLDLNLMFRRYEGSQVYDFTGERTSLETRATHLSLTLLYRFGHRPPDIRP